MSASTISREPNSGTASGFVRKKDFVRRPRRYLLLALALMLGFFAANPSGQLYAQEFRASITGTVADPTGAVIPGASVTAVNVATRTAYSAKSNSQGDYSVLYILPGTYTVTVEAAGFKEMVDSDVVLDTSQQLGLNVTLETGRVTQKVVVSVGALELDTVSASTGGVVDLARVANMPAPDMNVWDDVVFAQGISSNSKNLFNLTPRSNGNQNTVSGDQTDENAFYLNGVPVSDQGLWHFAPSQNAVDQVQAFAMPYDAQYGRTGGGVFTTNLKTGTNAYHGAMYNYYGNKVLNANPTEANLAGIPRATNTRDTWGAESGGPIIKGKTFYFGSYEGFSQIEPGPVSDTVPTAAEINGNFSGTGYTIYDPLSTYCAQKNASGGCTTYARKAFANDVIPAARISPIGKAILALPCAE